METSKAMVSGQRCEENALWYRRTFEVPADWRIAKMKTTQVSVTVDLWCHRAHRPRGRNPQTPWGG